LHDLGYGAANFGKYHLGSDQQSLPTGQTGD
jgi:hypothetical protein